MVLYSPVLVENVGFIQSKLCSLYIFVLWQFMFNHGSGRCVWAWGCIMLYDCWWFESVLCLGHRKLLGCRHQWWDITLSDAIHLLVESRTRQLLLRVIEVVVKFVYSVSVAVELLTHRMMNALLAKGGIFLVRTRRWRSDLLFAFVNNPLNVLLLNSLTRHSEWKAIRCWDIWVKLSRLSFICIRRWQFTMFLTGIVVGEARILWTKCICCRIHVALGLVEVTWFIKWRSACVYGVGSDFRESRIFWERARSFRRWVRQCVAGHVKDFTEINKWFT